jgi:hypothetical protein
MSLDRTKSRPHSLGAWRDAQEQERRGSAEKGTLKKRGRLPLQKILHPKLADGERRGFGEGAKGNWIGRGKFLMKSGEPDRDAARTEYRELSVMVLVVILSGEFWCDL